MKRLLSRGDRMALSAIAVTLLLTGCGASDESALRVEYEEGASSFAEGDFEGAQTYLESAVENDPGDAEAQFLLGQTYEAQGDLEAARSAYLASLESGSDQPQVLYNLAIIQQELGETGDAIANLKEAILLESDFVGARLALADLYASEGRKDEARAQYEIILEAEPYGIDLDEVRRKLDAL